MTKTKEPSISIHCKCGGRVDIIAKDWNIDLLGVWKFTHESCGEVIEVPNENMISELKKLKKTNK